jgi:O-antigen/teichoic acid export membrane protein
MIFPFLLFSPIMYSVSETTVVWINFKKKTYWHIVITAVSALVNYIGNALLVPVYAARGAAISTGVSYIVFFWMRTMISIGLCPEAGYKLKKMICATALMTFAALVGTFQNSPLVNVLIGLSGIPITIVIYKESFLALKDEISVMLRSKSHT